MQQRGRGRRRGHGRRLRRLRRPRADRGAEPPRLPSPFVTTPTSFDSAKFRQVLGHFPTGFTVITADDGDVPVGMAVGSFASVSLDRKSTRLNPRHYRACPMTYLA